MKETRITGTLFFCFGLVREVPGHVDPDTGTGVHEPLGRGVARKSGPLREESRGDEYGQPGRVS